MTKADLRRACMTQRLALTPNEVKRRSQLMAWYFFDYFESEGLADAPAFVHSFLPIRRQNEVDTWPIITCFWAKFAHIDISVPVVDLETRHMTHYTIYPAMPIVENRLGIPEPAPEHRNETDLRHVVGVIVPLLAFDRWGHRVGYGGGYYDRFLAESVPNARRIGLSFFGPVDEIAGIEPTDVRLDVCITPNRIYRFS